MISITFRIIRRLPHNRMIYRKRPSPSLRHLHTLRPGKNLNTFLHRTILKLQIHLLNIRQLLPFHPHNLRHQIRLPIILQRLHPRTPSQHPLLPRQTQLLLHTPPFLRHECLTGRQTNLHTIGNRTLIGLMIQTRSSISPTEVPRSFGNEFWIVWIDHGSRRDVDFGRCCSRLPGFCQFALFSAVGYGFCDVCGGGVGCGGGGGHGVLDL
mmetsp:Transcript_15531/g.20244  ORF Transcript_15531/g.20244 Transcript_15531/m.20244 type:complete len:210 (+) Transcript_15531:2421-3050(+)